MNISSSNPRRAANLRRVAACVLAAGLIGVLAARIAFAAYEPLWFDEAFTLAIVSPPDWASFWREVYLDVNGPAYYLLIRLWTELAGDSNLALRLPSIVAVALAGALPLVWPPPGLTRSARATWGVLIFAWWGVGFFLDARCYAMLLALSTFQCICFAKLMQDPRLRTAFIWAATGSLAILLHYYALFFCLAQGAIYLVRHRWTAVRTWPASLAFLPAFGFLAYHLPRLSDYSRLGRVWHPPVDAAGVINLVAFVISPTTVTVAIAVAVILALGLLLKRPAASPRQVLTAPLALAATSGGLTIVLVVLFAWQGSGLSPRYVIPAAPSLLLGVVLLAQRGGRASLTYAALILVYLGVQLRPAVEVMAGPQRLTRYEFETASRFLMAEGVSDMVFVWDHEVAHIMAAKTLERVGGVFFVRAGRPVRARPLIVTADQNPNRQIAAQTQGARSGFIWIYNRRGHTAAAKFAPSLGRGDPRWRCYEQGDGMVGTLACYRAPAPVLSAGARPGSLRQVLRP